MASRPTKPRIADRIAGWFGFERSKAVRTGAYQQGYQGARRDRLTAEWMPGNLTPDVLHRMDAKLLRERARDLVDNNPMARAAVKAYVANVVRCGIEPKPKRKVVDGDARKEWIEKWELWTAKDADLTRVQHFNELQKLFLEEVIVGGGCLVHFVYLPTAKARNRRLPLTVELIPEERLCDEGDMVGLSMGGKLKSGNRFARGVELDAETGEHVAYWVKPGLPNDLYTASEKPFRLPADQCIYAFHRTRIGQNRGITLLAASIMWLAKLGFYTDNEMMASAIRSCFVMAIETQGEPWGGMTGATGDPTSDLNGNRTDRIEPGMISYFQPGEKVVMGGPNVPPGDAQAWTKLIQRSIAVGMDLSYFGMMRDTADSNFAGFRAGLNEDRSRYEMLQDFTSFKLVQPTYERWVKASASTGELPFPMPSEYVADPDHFNAAIYQAPGWVSVAPLDDAKADEINLKIKTDSRTRIVGRRGEEFSEVFDEQAHEEEYAEALGLSLKIEEPAADEISSEDRK